MIEIKFNQEVIDEILDALTNSDFTDLYEEVFYDKIIFPFKEKNIQKRRFNLNRRFVYFKMS